MSDSSPTLSTPVGAIATMHPRAIPTLESLNLDYCCNGGLTLAQACQKQGLDPDHTLRSIIASSEEELRDENADPSKMSMTELADHIEATHHAFTREALASLQSMLPRLIKAHGQTRPELNELGTCINAFADDLEDHMVREERVLFPWLRRLDRKSEIQGGPPWSVRRPIDCMIHDHDNAGEMLERMRSLTHDYHVPADGCGTYRACMSLLGSLVRDTHIHIHKENNILFPRGIEAERERDQTLTKVT